MARGRCIPTADSSLTYYGSDADIDSFDAGTWRTTHGSLESIDCTNDYESIYGVKNLPPLNDEGSPNLTEVTVSWVEKSLPRHRGMALLINIFKTNIVNDTKMEIQVFDGDDNISNLEEVPLYNNSGSGVRPVGTDICQGEGNEMIYTYTFDSETHNSTSNLRVRIKAPGGGIFVRQLEVYLGNCEECSREELQYELQYMPRYRFNDSWTGLDFWLKFSQPISYSSNEVLRDSFEFRIDKINDNNVIEPAEFENEIKLNQRLHYFLPLNETFINGTVMVENTRDSRIFAKTQSASRRFLQRVLLSSRLNTLESFGAVDRYSSVNEDHRISMNQVYWFYRFFQWFALILMIITVMLGIGIVMEEFSILLQLLFLHVYISSHLLPATFKAPLEGLERMENLNYFADNDISSIEKQWFGDYEHPSPYFFQQFNKDILFLRSFYPTIIINLIYLGWFILMKVVCSLKPLKESKALFVKFLRSIPDRPLNFIDQIWRYQFITTIWAAFMQFYILKTDTAWERFNIAFCFIAFIISLLWPIFVIAYTYYITRYKYSS